MRKYTKDELREVLDKHAKWRRGESGGERANLARAYLAGAMLAEGETASWLHSGSVLSYSWNAWRMKDGSVRLRYGCEEHTLDEWPGLLPALCQEHVGAEQVGKYEATLSALVEFVRVCAETEAAHA